MRRTARLLPVVLTLVTFVAWLAEPAIAAAGQRPPVIVAAGDISPEGDGYDDETAAVIDDIVPDAVLTLGDHQYPDGELSDFRRYYDENWGRFLGMTYPAPGNHDCHVPRCAGYFQYFGDRADDGTYAYRIGRWLLVSLNSEGDIDAQDAFLRARLAASDARCALVYYHHPRFSSGPHGSSSRTAPWWETAYAAGVDVILAGHDHTYERFTRLDPDQNHARDGIRSFVVGTGGAALYDFGRPEKGSVERIRAYGVLRLRLERNGYAWAFKGVDGDKLDTGDSGCRA
jgi:hypothetical protein